MESEKITEQQALDALRALGWEEDEYGAWMPPLSESYVPSGPPPPKLEEYKREILRQFVLENHFAPFQKD